MSCNTRHGRNIQNYVDLRLTNIDQLSIYYISLFILYLFSIHYKSYYTFHIKLTISPFLESISIKRFITSLDVLDPRFHHSVEFLCNRDVTFFKNNIKRTRLECGKSSRRLDQTFAGGSIRLKENVREAAGRYRVFATRREQGSSEIVSGPIKSRQCPDYLS